MYTPNGRRHPNQGAGDRNDAWRSSYPDERGDGRWNRGEHEGAYGAQHGGYISRSSMDGADNPDRWSRDLGRHEDRWSHGYGYSSERMSGRFDTMSDVPSYHPSFHGKGPKGYTRSDERIREEICERLSEGYLDASDIEVSVQDGEVTLTGSIADRRTKRLAEELADGIRGVKDIENRLKLRSGGSTAVQKTEAPKTEAPKTEASASSSQNGAASPRV